MTHDEWPAPLAEKPSHPRDIAPPWSEHVQGVASAPGHWFISQADRRWRVPMNLDLIDADVDAPGVCSAEIPVTGIDHLGDCDYHDGLLYVAMSGVLEDGRVSSYQAHAQTSSARRRDGSSPPRHVLRGAAPAEADVRM